jgi:hypothetical protein
MMRDILKHKFDYTLLLVFSAIFVTFFLSYQHNPRLLVWGTIVFGVIYILWGLFHHLRTQSLTFKVMLEYLLVSCFAIMIVSTLLI